MEVVPRIARQGCHHCLLSEFFEANDALAVLSVEPDRAEKSAKDALFASKKLGRRLLIFGVVEVDEPHSFRIKTSVQVACFAAENTFEVAGSA